MASYLRGVALSPQQVAQTFYQAGWRGDDLIRMVGISTQREAGNESTNYHAYAGAHRTDTNQYGIASGDLGIAQVNWDAWGDQLISAGIINTHTDLFDPLTNAKAAKFILERQGWAAWGGDKNGWNGSTGLPHGVNLELAGRHVNQATSGGLVGQDWSANTATATATSTTTTNLPRDARLVEVPGVARYAMFQIQPGLWIRYAITANSGLNTANRYFTKLSSQEWANTFGNSVQGGDAAELAEIPTAFGTYAEFTNAILDQVFPKGDPRRNDPEIMRVLATRAGRPDMTEAEFENLLKGTKYYQSRTETQLAWNDYSEAERTKRRSDTAAQMASTWVAYVGPQGPQANADWWLSNRGDGVERVASGQQGFGAWTEQVKKTALGTAESPYARQVRTEEESQRQRPVDIENTVSRIRDTLADWGLQWADRTMLDWATRIVEKRSSDDDLMETIKNAAQTLYPWKDRDTETVVAASPWIETYNRVLERQGSLRTPEIAKALTAYGHNQDENDPWSFEQRLKLTDQYDQTRQGADDAYSITAELASAMGF